MKYKIILVPFPFDDFSQTKVRPAICLTNKIEKYNITSQVSRVGKTDLKITDLNETGLKVNSAIKLHRIVTISTNIIKRELGQLPISYHKHINNKLKELFDID